MNKTLSQNSQAQDVRIFVNANANTQSTSKKAQNKKRNKKTSSELSCSENSVCFFQLYLLHLSGILPLQKLYTKSSVNNCCCVQHKRYFSSQVPQKSNINFIIYLAI